uniref:Uncharacterized protein n=1 Tax=Glossina brevipalpis TaxID=37001 RepID=A0A1A9WMX5_9MUSC
MIRTKLTSFIFPALIQDRKPYLLPTFLTNNFENKFKGNGLRVSSSKGGGNSFKETNEETKSSDDINLNLRNDIINYTIY